MTPPLAHVAHYTWVLFVPPVLVVLWSIVHTTLRERRAARRDSAGDGRKVGDEENVTGEGTSVD